MNKLDRVCKWLTGAAAVGLMVTFLYIFVAGVCHAGIVKRGTVVSVKAHSDGNVSIVLRLDKEKQNRSFTVVEEAADRTMAITLTSMATKQPISLEYDTATMEIIWISVGR